MQIQRQPGQPAHENTIGVTHISAVGQCEVLRCAEKFLQNNPRFQTSQMGTNTKMSPTTKAHMMTGVGAVETQLLRVRIDLRIAIGRGPQQHQTISGL